MTMRLDVFRAIYAIEHDALASMTTPEVSVQSMPFLTTVEATVADRDNERARERCREAVKLLRRAAANVEEALRAFGPEATQPEPSPDRVVNDSTFHRRFAQDEHHRREEGLRR